MSQIELSDGGGGRKRPDRHLDLGLKKDAKGAVLKTAFNMASEDAAGDQ